MSKATDSSASLTEQDIVNFVAQAKYHQPQRITLVAHNMEMAKQWSVQYPGCEILVSNESLPTKSKAKDKER